jgi:hypothetical protein
LLAVFWIVNRQYPPFYETKYVNNTHQQRIILQVPVFLKTHGCLEAT